MNREGQEKVRDLNLRAMRQQADIVDQRFTRQTLEKRCRLLVSENEEVKCHLKEITGIKINSQRELEIVRRERNFLTESFKELKKMLAMKVN